MAASKTYAVWDDMLQRCTNPKSQMYKLYGERGISVCDEWQDFRNFLRDMGEKPPGLSLDRIDNDGNYESGNCRWTDMKTQNRNRRNNTNVRLRGEAMCITDAAHRLSLHPDTLWTHGRVFNTSPQETVDFYVAKNSTQNRREK